MCVYYLGLPEKGIASGISDPTFRIETEMARYCLKLEHRLSSWIPEHQDIALQFEKELASCVTVELHVADEPYQ